MKKKIGDLTLRELQKYHDNGCVEGALIRSSLCSGIMCSECYVQSVSRLNLDEEIEVPDAE